MSLSEAMQQAGGIPAPMHLEMSVKDFILGVAAPNNICFTFTGVIDELDRPPLPDRAIE